MSVKVTNIKPAKWIFFKKNEKLEKQGMVVWLGLDNKATDIKLDRAGVQAVADEDKHNPT